MNQEKIPEKSQERFLGEARFYEQLSGESLRCLLCPQACLISEGRRGHCHVRENRGGRLFTLVHSRLCAAHVDPIEKKPLFHFLPGSMAFSIAAAGCNLRCKFCQNWELAQARPEDLPAEFAPPALVTALARQAKCPSIAYTYTEPAVFAEYVMDTADAAHEAGLRSVAVSNGFVQQKPLREIYGRMDAVKIDLKAFSDKFYREIAGARLKPVLDTLLTLRSMGKWIEIVTLLLPTLNDSDRELRAQAQWIKSHLGPDVPLHFTQFHPDHKMQNLPVTPVETLERARAIALAEGLHFVYIGNVPGHAAQNTFCPGCGKILIERTGFAAGKNLIGADACCPYCHRSIAGVWS